MQQVCYVCGSSDVRFLALEPLPQPSHSAARTTVLQIDSYCEHCAEQAKTKAVKLIRIESVVIEGNGRKPAAFSALQLLTFGFDNLLIP